MYRVVWLAACAALAALGILVLSLVSPPLLAAMVVVFAPVGAVLGLFGVAGPGVVRGRHRARRAAVGGLAAGTAASAYVGLAIVTGPAVLLVTVLVAATAPSAIRLYGRWLRAVVAEPSTASIAAIAGWAPVFALPPPGQTPPPPPDLESLSTKQLCHAWCASYLALEDRSSQGDRSATLALVVERQRLLDELEKRNSAGFTAWLASDARVATNPLPFLTRSRTECPSIDWDELT